MWNSRAIIIYLQLSCTASLGFFVPSIASERVIAEESDVDQQYFVDQHLSPDEITRARRAMILARSLALVTSTASDLARSAEELEKVADAARAPQLSPNEENALMRWGPAALAPLGPMPRDYSASAAATAFAESAEAHRSFAQTLENVALDAEALSVDAALARIAEVQLPQDQELIVFPRDPATTGDLGEQIRNIGQSSFPLSLSGAEPFVVGLGFEARTVDFPAVGSLLQTFSVATSSGNATRAFVVCTGTLVGPSEFLTAAHCVCEKNEGNAAQCQAANSDAARIAKAKRLRVYFPHAGVFEVGLTKNDLIINPNYVSARGSTRGAKGDLALLHLTKPVKNINPLAITSASQPTGRLAQVVGFGTTNEIDSAGNILPKRILQEGWGVKLTASVITDACSSGVFGGQLCWKYEFNPSSGIGSTCHGDSGGPVLATMNGSTVLMGVITGVLNATGSHACGPGTELINMDMAFTDYNEWIRSALLLHPTSSVSTVKPILRPTENGRSRFLNLLPEIGASHTFEGEPARISLVIDVPTDSKFVVVGLNGTQSNAPLQLMVSNAADGEELCETDDSDTPAKVCSFERGAVSRAIIDVVGKISQEVQVVATSFIAN